jgi:hypothetical protein
MRLFYNLGNFTANKESTFKFASVLSTLIALTLIGMTLEDRIDRSLNSIGESLAVNTNKLNPDRPEGVWLSSRLDVDIKFDDAQHDWSDDSNIFFSKDEYVNYITAYDLPFIIFLTNKYIHLYRVISGTSLKHILNYMHNVPNLFHEYIYGYCTHGYLALLKENSLHYYKFNDDKTDFIFQKVYPANLFGVSGFTAITGVNAWNNTVLVKSNNSEVYYLDFRQPLKPQSQKIQLPEKTEEINFVKTVDLGNGGAVCYPHSLELFNLITGERQKGFYFVDEVLYLNYDQGSNNIVLLMKGKDYAIVVNTSPDTGFHRTHIKIEASNNNKLKLLRLGQSKLALLEPKVFSIINFGPTDEFFNFGETLSCLQMPASVGSFDFMMTYRQSNLVLINSKDDAGNIRMRHLRLKTSRNSLCHASCHGRCQKPFVACSQKPWVVISFAVASFIIGLLMTIFDRIIKACEKSKQKSKLRSYNQRMVSEGSDQISFVNKTKSNSIKAFFEPRASTTDLTSSIMCEDDESDFKLTNKKANNNNARQRSKLS